jgi:hypothetical protein
MGDVGDTFRTVDAVMKKRKEALGVDCPACKERLSKAIPKVLLPGQKCWCGYRDPRPNQSHEFWEREK